MGRYWQKHNDLNKFQSTPFKRFKYSIILCISFVKFSIFFFSKPIVFFSCVRFKDQIFLCQRCKKQRFFCDNPEIILGSKKCCFVHFGFFPPISCSSSCGAVGARFLCTWYLSRVIAMVRKTLTARPRWQQHSAMW